MIYPFLREQILGERKYYPIWESHWGNQGCLNCSEQHKALNPQQLPLLALYSTKLRKKLVRG